jgi:hypothetical protein
VITESVAASNSFQGAEGVVLVTLGVGFVFWWLLQTFARTRPDFRVGTPIAVAYGLRLVAIVGIGASGLQSSLRGGDEVTYLDNANILASTPLGHGFLPHGSFQLQTVLFALEMKLGFLTEGAMRIIQVGIAMAGLILIVAAVHDLAGARASRIAAWLLALEPARVFFDSGLYKDPNMELAAGLIVFGTTMIWKRLDVRGILLCVLGGAIAVETRSYAGWFLVSAAVLVALLAAIRHLDRPMRTLILVFAIAIAGFALTPVLLQVSSKQSLKTLQASQDANAEGIGQGEGTSNSDNLALEKVDFSSRGAVLKNLPKRVSELVLQPYPWQLSNNSQRSGAIGTIFAYGVFALLLLYGWQSRGAIFSRAGPVLIPLLLLTIAYALSVGNAGTGFRYRTHLTTLAIAAMVILREVVVRKRVESRTPVGQATRLATGAHEHVPAASMQRAPSPEVGAHPRLGLS